MRNPRPKILDIVESKGYKVFENGDYDLNLIGVRKKDGTPNKYDDTMTVCYKRDGLWQQERYPITTDPGVYWLHHPMRVEGTAILVPGQYRSAYKIALHRGKYSALVQKGRVKVFRDNNKDSVHDMAPDSVMDGYFGINIHRSGKDTTTRVNKYSAGCQVFSDFADFANFMDLCELQASERGWKTFTYTLLEEEDASV